MQSSWRMIFGWFAQHHPDVCGEFRGPADEKDIEAVEQATGRSLPTDQLAWWRLCDGTERYGPVPLHVPVAWAPASTALALDSHRSLTNDLARYWPDLMEQDSEPAGTSTDIPWLPSWLPIAHDLGGNYLFLDLREGPAHGCVGVQYNDDAFTGEPAWWSVADMLADVADALTNDTDINGWYAEAANGHIRWRSG
ncbi:SMI1/KNR4 family protein [Actinoplanes sp. NPDC051513]|uniref:SMI1/KNR4 family protein n=1 Tax=Actinoplanes sp. NPDC051513 TaxID=3363908 RepID=UPI0037B6CA81